MPPTIKPAEAGCGWTWAFFDALLDFAAVVFFAEGRFLAVTAVDFFVAFGFGVAAFFAVVALRFAVAEVFPDVFILDAAVPFFVEAFFLAAAVLGRAALPAVFFFFDFDVTFFFGADFFFVAAFFAAAFLVLAAALVRALDVAAFLAVAFFLAPDRRADVDVRACVFFFCAGFFLDVATR